MFTSPSFSFGADGCASTTVFLSHFDGPDASTTPTDEDCNGNGKITITAANQAQLDDQWSAFGPTSFLSDGTGDAFILTDHSDLAFGTGDYTWTARVRFASVAASQTLYSRNSDAVEVRYEASIPDLRLGIGGVLIKSESWTPSANVDYWIVFTRRSGNLDFYVNGVKLGSTTGSETSNWAGGSNFYIGSLSTGGQSLNGRMDELMMMKGQAMKDFTVPTTPYCSGCEMLGEF